MSEISEFEKLSAERKEMIARGECPEWMITQGYGMFKKKYSHNGETVRGAFERISTHLAQYVPELPEAKDAFFRIMWKGHLGPSTPVYANTGTGRGHNVSCSGGYIGDSVKEFYDGLTEAALLSKNGYGTSAYLGDIRPRGAPINKGGEASGIVPVIDDYVTMSGKISQGNSRRGSWAGYVPVDHGDFWELTGYILKNRASVNIGWNFTDDFIERLVQRDPEAIARFNKVCYLRSVTGKGYIFKPDTANRLSPQAVKNSGISIKGSNLCSEIMLPSDKDHTFSCVLSSLNLAKWDEFDDDTIFWAVVMLDCVVSDMLTNAEGEEGFEKIKRFTEKSRAIGLGVMGLATYFQEKGIVFDSLEAQFENVTIFSTIWEKAQEASRWLAKRYGEPEWCKGTGMRNTTLIAIAPTVSNALLCGGVSQGIEPYVSNTYTQATAAGEVERVNPYLMKIMREKGIFTQDIVNDIAIHNGSVQHRSEFTDDEKQLLKTAYEMDQFALVRMASQRQRYIDQGQSLNLFFGEDEEYVGSVIKEILLDPNIKSAYYQRSIRGVKPVGCVSCEG